jgi:hypothetical protein
MSTALKSDESSKADVACEEEEEDCCGRLKRALACSVVCLGTAMLGALSNEDREYCGSRDWLEFGDEDLLMSPSRSISSRLLSSRLRG